MRTHQAYNLLGQAPKKCHVEQVKHGDFFMTKLLVQYTQVKMQKKENPKQLGLASIRK